MRSPNFYICPPSVPRLPGTYLGSCQLCGQQVQFKPGGPEQVEAATGARITMICTECAHRDIPADMLRQPNTRH